MTATALAAPDGIAHITASPTSTSERIERLISVLDRLAALLSEETKAVRGRDYVQVDALSETKGLLAQNYGERMRELNEYANDDDDVEPGLASRMRDSLKAFLGIVESNARAFGAARTAHERHRDQPAAPGLGADRAQRNRLIGRFDSANILKYRVIPPSGMPDSRWGFPSGPISDSMW